MSESIVTLIQTLGDQGIVAYYVAAAVGALAPILVALVWGFTIRHAITAAKDAFVAKKTKSED